MTPSRAATALVIPLGAIALAIAAEGCAPVPTPASSTEPCTTIRWVSLADDRVRIEVVGADTPTLAEFARTGLTTEKAASFFTVAVDQGGGPKRTPMLGTYRVSADILAFEPRFPLQRGLQYRAEFDGDRFRAAARPAGVPSESPTKPSEPISEVFSLPVLATEPTSIVAVYPSSPNLPENLLRFYIHFSAPMSKGEAYTHLHLLDGTGKTVDKAFLEIGEELWDPRGERFTLVFDPGRIKRGLKPREDLGPVLEAGKTYTLVIDADWPDANGNSLSAGLRKTFRTTAEDARCPDPNAWKVISPSRPTDPLTLEFPEPLDHAMLARVITVVDPSGKPVAGQVAIDGHEMRWRFSPEQPWTNGVYKILVEQSLEDLAGNSIAEPFEVDVFKKVERHVPAESALKFEFKGQGGR